MLDCCHTSTNCVLYILFPSSGKASKKGRLALVRLDGEWKTIQEVDPTKEEEMEGEDQLRLVYENGKLVVDDKFDAIRERAAKALGI